MEILKSLRKTPEDKAAEHLYQARMDLLEAERTLDHYRALVIGLKDTVSRLEQRNPDANAKIYIDAAAQFGAAST